MTSLQDKIVHGASPPSHALRLESRQYGGSDKESPVHHEPTVRVRILYADTDAGGVVYNAAYLRFLESARTEAVRACGAPYSRLVDQGLHLPLVEQTIRYRSPAYYDDVLAVYVSVGQLRRVQVAFDYEVRREADAQLIVTARTLHGCVDVGTGRPVGLPEWARQSLRLLQVPPQA